MACSIPAAFIAMQWKAMTFIRAEFISLALSSENVCRIQLVYEIGLARARRRKTSFIVGNKFWCSLCDSNIGILESDILNDVQFNNYLEGRLSVLTTTTGLYSNASDCTDVCGCGLTLC